MAWRNVRDWVTAQLVFYETRMVDMPQVFLPFAAGSGGKTLYEQIQSNQFLLGSGENNLEN